MKYILFFLSLYVFSFPAITSAQDTVHEYPIQELEISDPLRRLLSPLSTAIGVLADSIGGIDYMYADVEDARYHLFHISEPLPELGPHEDPTERSTKGTLVLVSWDKQSSQYKQSNIPLRKYVLTYGNIPSLSWKQSTLFIHNDIPYLKLHYSAFNDFTNIGYVRFFAARGDSLSRLGGISLYDTDDASGYMWHTKYAGELLPFTASSEGVHITHNRRTFSTYPIDYLLTPDSLALVKDHTPEFHITKEEAQTELASILENYYSEQWKKKSPKYRANRFQWNFLHLSIKRHDFAPAHYNLACMYAQLEDTESALISLQKAFELDSSYIEKAKTDSDLVSLREMPEFQALVE